MPPSASTKPFLSDVEQLALGRFDARAARDAVDEGAYDFDFKLRVVGQILVQKDYHQLFVTMGDWQRLFAHLFAKWHARTGETLADLVREAFPDPETFRVEDARAAELANQLRKLLEPLKPKTLCKGPVRGAPEFRRLKS